MKNQLKGVVFSLSIGLLLFASYMATEVKGEMRDQTLIVGKVSDDPEDDYEEYKIQVDFLVDHLKDLGLRQSSVLLPKNNQEMIQVLKEGKIDLVIEGVFSAFLYHEETGAEIIAKKAGGKSSLFFIRKDSGLRDLSQLKGKKIAFEDPGSTSAFFIPMAFLRREGLELVELPSLGEEPPPDKVGYVFAGAELNIVAWVHKGLVDAGAFGDSDWEKPKYTPDVLKKDLKILYQTDSISRSLVLIRRGLDPKVRDRIKETMLKAHENEETRKFLEEYFDVEKFEEISKEEFEEMDRLTRYLLEELM